MDLSRLKIAREFLTEGEERFLDRHETVAGSDSSAIDYYLRGVKLRTEGDLADARKSFDEAIELDPEYVDAYVARGLTWQDEGEVPQSLEDFDRAIELEPNAAAYARRAWAHAKLRDSGAALEHLIA